MSQDLYAGFFGLSARPFTVVPDPEFLFWSDQHRRAYAVLEFGIMSRAPITLITGEVGAGKTTLLHALLGKVTEELRIGLISNAQGDRGELLQWAMSALGMELRDGESYVRMYRRLQDQLVADYAAGRRVILIFDEAQNLSLRGLEELRMFTNINSNKDELVQLILVGQPELRDVILGPDMRQLAQRVAASFHLDALDQQGTADFIAHRLQLAGGAGEEFELPAAAVVFEATHGVPRLINHLCDLAMLYAWSENQRKVTEQIVQRVLDDGVFFGGGTQAKESH